MLNWLSVCEIERSSNSGRDTSFLLDILKHESISSPSAMGKRRRFSSLALVRNQSRRKTRVNLKSAVTDLAGR